MPKTVEEQTNELRKYIYDPNLIQVSSMELLNEGLNGELDLPDPTNPFIFLMENNALVTSAGMQEMSVTMRRLYPYLSTEKSELYQHINAGEINDVFSAPSMAKFNIFLNKQDMLTYGYRNNNYTEMIIPSYSYIEVAGVTFTLLNDILVRLYDNDKTFVKYMSTDIDIGELSDVPLTSGVVTDGDGGTWILIDVEIKQVKRYSFSDTLMASKPYRMPIGIPDKENYTFIRSYSHNNLTNQRTELHSTFSNFVYDPSYPTIIVRPSDNVVEVEVPTVYMLNNMVSDYIDIELYTTQGNVDLPLTNYTSGDFIFSIVMPDTTDPRIVGIQNINYVVNASTFTYGGKKEISFEDLKRKIVNYSTGDNSLPITTYEVEDVVSASGFVYAGLSDTILEREYLLHKNLGAMDYTSVFSGMDMFQHGVSLFMPDINSDKIITTNHGKSIVIEPFQLFEKKSGVVKPLTNAETAALENLATTDHIAYSERNVFFNLYKYVMDNDDELAIRVYDVNVPTVSNARGLYTNEAMTTPIVINSRTIFNLGDSYELTYGLAKDGELMQLDLDQIYCQVSIDIDINSTIYMKGNLIVDGNDLFLRTVIDHTAYIDSEDKLTITTIFGDLLNGRVPLDSEVKFVMYSTDASAALPGTKDPSTVIVGDATVIMYEEIADVSFGNRLEHIFTNYRIDYTERKFLTYDEDIILTYEKNVYQLGPDGLIETTPIDTDGDGVNDDVEFTLLHRAGDTVFDGNGDPIYKHKAGDIILDEFDRPTIDPVLGVIHNTSILLLEDIFLRTSSSYYRSYRVDYFMTLTSTLDAQVAELDADLLENTVFKFVALNNLGSVVIDVNDKKTSYDNFVSPTVTLYIEESSGFYITDEIEKQIYVAVQDGLITELNVTAIEKNLEELLGPDILSVQIKDISPNNDVNLLKYAEGSSKFILDKKLYKHDDGTMVVKPSGALSIKRI